MKMKGIIFTTISVFVFTLSTGITLKANQDDVLPVYMELITWKYSDNNRSLIANLLSEDAEGDEIPATGISVFYYLLEEDEQVLIGEAISNDEGNAIYNFPEGYEYPKDEEGYVTVFAEFQGDRNFDYAEAELSFKDVDIDFEFVEEDDERLIFFKGIIFGKNDTVPLADDDLYFYVPRMFSDLNIAEGWFEENGEGIVEFPLDIIGDSAGVVEVIARISEHFDYGYVEKRKFINWAVPFHAVAREVPTRELWTPIAPLWMIITLIIMLVGVWGHYIYAIYELYMIKKLGRKKKDRS